MNKIIVKRLDAFQRNILRRMFGGIKVNENAESDIMKNSGSCLEFQIKFDLFE